MSETISVEVIDQFASKAWRLANLYWIEDANGHKVKFVPNEAQQHFFDTMWYLNINCKARQLGFTTGVCIWMLDECLFYPGQTAGVIAHTLDDAKKIFRTKIDYPYRNLPLELQNALPADSDTAQELVFTHPSDQDEGERKSSISVATSTRSGTCQYLLVSEFGLICAKYPEKAEEIVAGSLNTVHPGNYIVIESTAEGTAGYFYQFYKRAQDLAAEVNLGRKNYTQLDFKPHFYGWYWDPSYVLSPEEAREVAIDERMQKYFTELEAQDGIYLTQQQKAWYIKKRETLGELIYAQYPATWQEAFRKSITGSFFAEQFLKVRKEGRITKVPYQEGVGVDTWWDLGLDDETAIWFTQELGREVHLIDYLHGSDYGLNYYLDTIKEWKLTKGYSYRYHVGPHDLEFREWGNEAKTRTKSAAEQGINFIVAPKFVLADQIDAARNLLSICWFDAERCEDGILALENFRKVWSERQQSYLERTPLDNWAAHGASAFCQFAMMREKVAHGAPRRHEVRKVSAGGWT